VAGLGGNRSIALVDEDLGPCNAASRASRLTGRRQAAEDQERGRAMKQLLWAVPVAVVCVVLLAGRDDVRRFREMRRL
jgi:hypothetical protein